jgi:hypothetical protein
VRALIERSRLLGARLSERDARGLADAVWAAEHDPGHLPDPVTALAVFLGPALGIPTPQALAALAGRAPGTSLTDAAIGNVHAWRQRAQDAGDAAAGARTRAAVPTVPLAERPDIDPD